MNNETVVAPNPRLPEKSQRRHRTARLATLLLVVFVFGSVIVSKANRREAATRFSQESARGKPSVSVVASAAAPAIVDLTLPGNTEAVVVSDIYARATGYVKARYANIGDRVRAGQMLAQIESPELDQELAQAKATLEESRAAWRQAEANVSRAQEGVIEARARLAQSQANEALAATTSERWTRLVEKGVLPRQEGDERQYAFRARKAEAEASAASMPVLTRRMRRCSSVASFCSTIASTCPSGLRTMRP